MGNSRKMRYRSPRPNPNRRKFFKRAGFGIFIFWIVKPWIFTTIFEQEICIGDFCLESCDPGSRLLGDLDLRNSSLSSNQFTGIARHCFIKLKRPQEVFFVKLINTNMTNSYVQLFFDYGDDKILRDTKMTYFNHERDDWTMIPMPEKNMGPKEGYVNSLTGQLMKPKESGSLLIEIFQKSYESFTFKFRNCINQKSDLYNSLFDQFC